jgi:hypothetical protein
MTSIPSWILLDLNQNKYASSSLTPNDRFLKKLDLKNLKFSKEIAGLHKKSKILKQYRPNKVNIIPIELKKRCSKLWHNFDSRVSSILQKYNPSPMKHKQKIPSFSPQLEFYNKKPEKKNFIESRRFSGPVQFSDPNEIVAESGIQCDLSSDVSENDIIIYESRYMHPINLRLNQYI